MGFKEERKHATDRFEKLQNDGQIFHSLHGMSFSLLQKYAVQYKKMGQCSVVQSNLPPVSFRTDVTQCRNSVPRPFRRTGF